MAAPAIPPSLGQLTSRAAAIVEQLKALAEDALGSELDLANTMVVRAHADNALHAIEKVRETVCAALAVDRQLRRNARLTAADRKQAREAANRA